MTKFYHYIMAESQTISNILSIQVDMLPLTKQDKEKFRSATHSECCEEAFTTTNPKVRHYDHISGSICLRSATNNCNLQLKPKKFTKKTGVKRQRDKTNDFFLPVLFHNVSGFDYHFIIKHVQRKYLERQKASQKVTIDDVVIPQNSEKYLMFQIGHLRFLVSFQFLPTSLEQLVSLLRKSGKQFRPHRKVHECGRRRHVFQGNFPLQLHDGQRQV